MTRASFITGVAAIFLFIVPTGVAASWVEVKTPAFTVVTDGSEQDGRRVAARFEQIRSLLEELWPWARLDTPRPVTILAVRSEGGMKQLLPGAWEKKGGTRPAGYFLRAPERFWVALRTDLERFREDQQDWRNPHLVVFHEYVHLVLSLNFEQVPLWLNEGLAEYWGNTIVEGDRLYTGRHIPAHLMTLRRRGTMPLAELFAVTHDSPEYTEQNRTTLFYAQSWALVHFLALGSEARAGQLDLLAQRLYERKPVGEAVGEALGDLEKLEEEFGSYAHRLAFKYQRRRTTIAPDATDFETRVLSEAESLSVRAAFLVATGRPVEARALAEESLALKPDAAAPHEVLALLAWRDGRYDDALQALVRATERPDASDFAHYLLGRTRWRQESGPESLRAVESSFRRAVELNPSFAAAHESLALVMAARGAPLEQTLPVVAQAIRIEPGNIDHQISALRIAGRGGRGEEVRSLAEALLSRTDGPERARVEALIAELDGMSAPPPPPTRVVDLSSIQDAACEEGAAEACALLGARYREGGIARDAAKAVSAFERACAAGHRDSCSATGWAYERGDGVDRDLDQATSLYRRACDQADAWACSRLERAATGEEEASSAARASRTQEDAAFVVVDIVVEDSRGRALVDLTAGEFEVTQSAEKQKIARFEARDGAGHYRLSFTPHAGEPGAVYVRCLRPGSQLRGPDGPGLKPRFVRAPTALEKDMDIALDEAMADELVHLDLDVSVFRFDTAPAGVHVAVAAEAPLEALAPAPGYGLDDAQLEIFARFSDEDGYVVRRVAWDRRLVIPPLVLQRLVWTGDLHLPAGLYTLELLLRERSTGRAAVRTLDIELPSPQATLQMSSVVLLRPRDETLVRDGSGSDPLFLGDEPLMPSLDVVLPVGTDAPVRFFVIVYPAAESEDPPSLELELLRDGTRVGRSPLALPPPGADGAIRYVGELATETFRALPYALRLVARQGDETASVEASFQMRARDR